MSYFNPQIVLISNLCLFLKNKWNKGAFPVIECINVLSVFGNKSVFASYPNHNSFYLEKSNFIPLRLSETVIVIWEVLIPTKFYTLHM